MPKHITLIGMSRAGKTPRRKELVAEAGYTGFCCDDLIEERLKPHLEAGGFKGIDGVAQWMGLPYEPHSSERQTLYLEQEKVIMRDAVRALRESTVPLAIDTTGSVIYLDDEILTALRIMSTVVLLNTPTRRQRKMYEKYLEKPRPVIWGDAFSILKGESPEEALARCYPLLLQYRQKQYKRWADVTIGYRERRRPRFDTRAFLKKVLK